MSLRLVMISSTKGRRSNASTISSSVRSSTAASRAALVGFICGAAIGPPGKLGLDSISIGEAGAERLDVGAVLRHAAGSLADDRRAGRRDHGDDRIDADL